MKVSISLPDADVEFLDAYAAEHGLSSRSAAIRKAIQLLRSVGLGAAYGDAWSEWSSGNDRQLWESTVADGTGE